MFQLRFSDVTVCYESLAGAQARRGIGCVERDWEDMEREVQDLLDRTGLSLSERADGLYLEDGALSLKADFVDMKRRLAAGKLQQELLVKAVRLKGFEGIPMLLDATAGLGHDALLVAAAGFEVQLFERNPVIAALLADAVQRARTDDVLRDAACRMHVHEGDSIEALESFEVRPDVVYLDPMFPARTKSAAVKKKFQLLQKLEAPCDDAGRILDAAIRAQPRKIVVKRPLKGPFLDDVVPAYSLKGKAIRYDCLVFA